MLYLLVAVLVGALGLWWWFNNERDQQGQKPIPGPYGLPMLGNVLQLGSKMHLKFGKWAEQYGDIFQIKLGNRRAVVISDPKWMKEIFTVEPAFAGRVFFEGFEIYPNEPLGMVTTEGELWEVHRRFLLRQLRDFGFGKSTMEQLIMDEVNESIQRFKSAKDNRLSDVKGIFQVAVINSLWMLVSSKRFNQDDPQLREIISDSERIVNQIASRAVMFFVPWTRHFLPPLADFELVRDRNRKFYEDAVAEHKATFKEDTARDFIDVYLMEMKAQENNPTSMFYGSRAERQLVAILGDLFFAGTDTTSSTLSWALLYLSKFQNVQKKLQEEISHVTGDNRMVQISDRPNMPYTLGIIEETLRWSSIVPTGVQHRAMTGKEFKGYYIPRDTWIFPNLYYVHHSPKFWGDPENFRPERFLGSDGKTFKKNENLQPFQIGRRQCVGESLARDTIFLFLTNIFHRFSVALDPNEPEPSLEPKVGLILSPEPYSVVFQDRNVKVN